MKISSTPAWTTDTRLDQSMFSSCLHHILNRPSECRSRNWDSSEQATVFLSSIVQFWWVRVELSLHFAILTWQECHWCSDAEGLLLPSLVYVQRCSSASRFGVFCVQRCSSASRFGVFCVQRCSSASRFGVLCVQRCSSPSRFGVWTDTFLCKTIFCKPCLTIPVDQQFPKHPDQPIWHQQPCHVTSVLPHSDAQIVLQQIILTMSTCLNTSSFCYVIDWLDI